MASRIKKCFRKFIRRMPPFRGIYYELDRLSDENTQLKAREKQQLRTLQDDFARRLEALEKEHQLQMADMEKSFQRQMESLKADEASHRNDFEQKRILLEQKQKELDTLYRKLNDRVDWVVGKEKETAENLRTEQKKQKETAGSLQKEIKALGESEKKERRELQKSLKKDLTGDIEYYYYKLLPEERYEEELKEWYYNKTGERLDLEHPLTYNEKIQWMKLYDSTPLKTRLADKYLVRDWAAERIGDQYLIPLLGVYDRFDEIDFDALPDRFVIKTNHAYKTNWIVEDKSTFDRKAAKRFFDKAMQRDFAYRAGLQLHYKGIRRKLIIEEYLENSTNNLDDYKVYCFGGKAECIEYMTGRNQELRAAFFDTEWNRLPIRRTAKPCERQVEKPQNLKTLVRLAETLGRGFSHVRVDFYMLNDGSIKFGEMTFTPANGAGKWYPPEYEQKYGDMIQLP